MLARVERELSYGRPKQALSVASRRNFNSPWAVNARATCLLRLGRYPEAVVLLRGLVLGSGGLSYRQDVPTIFQANFATALLASGNLSGCLSMLKSIQDTDHPAVVELRSAIDDWNHKLSPWQRLRWRLGADLPLPQLAFPLGHVT